MYYYFSTKVRKTKIINKIKEFPNFNYVEQFLSSEMNSVSKSYVFQLNKMMFDNLYFKEKSNELCCLDLKIESPQVIYDIIKLYFINVIFNINCCKNKKKLIIYIFVFVKIKI